MPSVGVRGLTTLAEVTSGGERVLGFVEVPIISLREFLGFEKVPSGGVRGLLDFEVVMSIGVRALL